MNCKILTKCLINFLLRQVRARFDSNKRSKRRYQEFSDLYVIVLHRVETFQHKIVNLPFQMTLSWLRLGSFAPKIRTPINKGRSDFKISKFRLKTLLTQVQINRI